jgi:unsaturated rhamnogalacturonyl hydrolase
MENYIIIAEKVIQKLMDTKDNPEVDDHFNVEIWEWPQGVAMYSLYLYYRKTKQKKYLDFISNWYERRIKEGLPDKNVNTVTPLLTMIHLYELKKDPRYLFICNEWAHWITSKMPKTDEDGFQHITSDLVNDCQIWADTLFMTVLFLAKMGMVTANMEYIEQSIYQYLLHIKYLSDPVSGLWYHGWTFNKRHNFGGIFWARGNSWYTLGIVELLEIVNLSQANKNFVIQALKNQVAALCKLQNDSGLWHTILTDTESYLETSASAGFAYGILKAVRRGYIDKRFKEYAVKAVEGVVKKVDGTGIVHGVSHGTPLGNTVEHYRNIPCLPTAYGQGLTFLMLVEYLISSGK